MPRMYRALTFRFSRIQGTTEWLVSRTKYIITTFTMSR